MLLLNFLWRYSSDYIFLGEIEYLFMDCLVVMWTKVIISKKNKMHPAHRKSDGEKAINLRYENVFIFCILNVMMSRVSNKNRKNSDYFPNYCKVCIDLVIVPRF